MSEEEEFAILELARVLDTLDHRATKADRTARRSEANRLTMLHLHAAIAVVVGPLFAAIGNDGMTSPIWVVARNIPGSPYTLGAVMFIGGVILGVATHRRDVRWEMVGLWMLFTWYTTIAVSFGSAVLIWLGGDQSTATPSFYAPFVYAHLSGVMLIHIRTLKRKLRDRK